FKRISELIEQSIAEHKAQRLSDLEFLERMLEAREQVVRPKRDDVPDQIKKNDTAIAFFHLLERELQEVSGGKDAMRAIATDAAAAFARIIEAHKVVNWIQREDVQNIMRNELDDYLFDVVRDKKGVALTENSIDEIVDGVLVIARAR